MLSHGNVCGVGYPANTPVCLPTTPPQALVMPRWPTAGTMSRKRAGIKWDWARKNMNWVKCGQGAAMVGVRYMDGMKDQHQKGLWTVIRTLSDLGKNVYKSWNLSQTPRGSSVCTACSECRLLEMGTEGKGPSRQGQETAGQTSSLPRP